MVLQKIKDVLTPYKARHKSQEEGMIEVCHSVDRVNTEYHQVDPSLINSLEYQYLGLPSEN